jgi:RNA polymerase sigma-70 factor (ECF subfamily)
LKNPASSIPLRTLRLSLCVFALKSGFANRLRRYVFPIFLADCVKVFALSRHILHPRAIDEVEPQNPPGDFVSDTLADAKIVQGLQNGDRWAWEALCRQFGPRVWKYVARLVGGNEDAIGDVFQETMLAVAKAGRTLVSETRIWPWLAAIGHNQAALYWRKSYRSRTVVSTREFLDLSLEDDPLDKLLQSETVDLVRSLLAEMNSDAVSLLLGKYLDGHSVLDLVNLMGGTEESLRSRLARARKDFRSRYERAIKHERPAETPRFNEVSPREGDAT